jgi:DNA-binding IclR family transcriptional regulator
VSAVDAPLPAADRTLIAAISAATEPAAAKRLDRLGEQLKKAIAKLAPQHGLHLADQAQAE